MAAYPAAIGYQSWRAWQAYSSGLPGIIDVPYMPGRGALPVAPIGPLLWYGVFRTPVGATSINGLIDGLDEGINTLTLPFPECRVIVEARAISVEAQTWDSRGVVRGWSVEWMEVK